MNELLRYLIDQGILLPGTSEAQARAIAPKLAEELDQARAFTLEPSSWNDEERSVDGVLSTDRPVPMPDYDRMEMVDEVLLASGFRSRSGETLPLLDSHKRWSGVSGLLGSVTDLATTAHDVRGRLRISSAEPAVATKVREGHLRGISVGYQNLKAVTVEPGESREVNGKTYTAKKKRALRVVTEWEAHEASLTPIQADVGSAVRSRSGQSLATPSTHHPVKPNTNTQNGGVRTTMNKYLKRFLEANPTASVTDFDQFRSWLESLETDPTDAAVRAHLEAKGLKLDAESPEDAAKRAAQGQSTAGLSADQARKLADEQFAAYRKAEADRRESIRSAAAAYLSQPGVRELMESSLDSNHSADAFRGALLKHLADKQPAFGRASVGTEQRDKTRAAMQDAIALRSSIGLPKLAHGDAFHGLKDEERQAAAGQFRGFTLLDLARHSLESAGESARGLDKLELVGRAFTHSTSDFPYILENLANKMLLQAYLLAPQSWTKWCKRGSLSDFKTASRLRLSEAGVFSEVPENAEFPEHGMSENKESITLKTYGKIFSISRQAIINDDLSAFDAIPLMHGRAWARTINRLAITKLLANPTLTDTVALFNTAGHANIDGSSANATTVATAQTILRAVRKLMVAQLDLDGASKLGIMPSLVLVPPTVEEWFVQAVYETGRSDNNRTVDVARMNLEVVMDAELENSAISGYSASATYHFANPMDAPVMEVAFLDGNDQPRMERESGFTVDGVKLKVAGDVGVAPIDYRGGVKQLNGAS